MSKGIFVTATGTDIGKTYISSLLVKALIKNKINAGYYKPVLSGAIVENGTLIPGDVDFVSRESGLKNKYEDLVTYVFKTPVSPHMASKLENIKIEKEIIIDHYNRLKNKFDYTVVEGCGGIFCPLRIDTEQILLTDIIKMMGLDIVIVASSDLGTINSTVLTVEYARSCNIGIAGIILNNYEKENYLHDDNKEKIELLTGVKVISCVKKDDKDIEMTIENCLELFSR
ncbi:dethiobiotin synthase [Metaclostridioides mangenotii]|uniref:ATP-dependent dethiobiotin synthetase BioD n=1 Tax=Metaclostridioides mangenotii TaxID=1540 RepID=A0ABS4E881_9FIRM|nr:dethiobiotin synthase [Clostridioides mangenotii]MBP1854134.1 dethiobiotin synthetase [Clostridioides mangenotii]